MISILLIDLCKNTFFNKITLSKILNPKQTIGKRIKELRLINKFTQSQLSNELFITQSAYCLIENSRNSLSTEHIICLSNFYGVTTDFILKGDQLESTIKIQKLMEALEILKKDIFSFQKKLQNLGK